MGPVFREDKLFNRLVHLKRVGHFTELSFDFKCQMVNQDAGVGDGLDQFPPAAHPGGLIDIAVFPVEFENHIFGWSIANATEAMKLTGGIEHQGRSGDRFSQRFNLPCEQDNTDIVGIGVGLIPFPRPHAGAMDVEFAQVFGFPFQ